MILQLDCYRNLPSHLYATYPQPRTGPWLQPDHPDPLGQNLAILAAALTHLNENMGEPRGAYAVFIGVCASLSEVTQLLVLCARSQCRCCYRQSAPHSFSSLAPPPLPPCRLLLALPVR